MIQFKFKCKLHSIKSASYLYIKFKSIQIVLSISNCSYTPNYFYFLPKYYSRLFRWFWVSWHQSLNFFYIFQKAKLKLVKWKKNSVSNGNHKKVRNENRDIESSTTLHSAGILRIHILRYLSEVWLGFVSHELIQSSGRSSLPGTKNL